MVILTEADRLTRDAQAALRRTMEKHSTTCRLILVCNNPSKVIDPVRSRCLGIRVPAPTVRDMMGVMTAVAQKEGLTLPPQLAARVAAHSDRNMRRALLMLEAAKVQQYPFTPDQKVTGTDWERYIASIATDVRSCRKHSHTRNLFSSPAALHPPLPPFADRHRAIPISPSASSPEAVRAAGKLHPSRCHLQDAAEPAHHTGPGGAGTRADTLGGTLRTHTRSRQQGSVPPGSICRQR